MSEKMSDKQLLPCPFCGIDGMYEIIIDNEFGDSEPALFCNVCKMTFQVENDSPYMNADETYKYLKEKLHKTFNTRKPLERILEHLEEKKTGCRHYNEYRECFYEESARKKGIIQAIEIVKEEM